jgi:hypothetical protein
VVFPWSMCPTTPTISSSIGFSFSIEIDERVSF